MSAQMVDGDNRATLAAVDQRAALAARNARTEISRKVNPSPEHAEKIRKFEDWQTRRQNDLQDRHLKERDDLARRCERRWANVKTQIENTYRKTRRAGEQRLAELVERAAQGNTLSRFVDKARGHDSERAAIEKSLATIDQRTEEMITPVLKQEQTEFTMLADKQQHEIDGLSSLFDRHVELGYEIRANPSLDAGLDLGRER